MDIIRFIPLGAISILLVLYGISLRKSNAYNKRKSEKTIFEREMENADGYELINCPSCNNMTRRYFTKINKSIYRKDSDAKEKVMRCECGFMQKISPMFFDEASSIDKAAFKFFVTEEMKKAEYNEQQRIQSKRYKNTGR